MARRGCVCGICENVNQASVCISCINHRFLEKLNLLKDLAQDCDLLRRQLDEELIAKGTSYADSRPASHSEEYPLFLPRQGGHGTSVDRNSEFSKSVGNNFGLSSMENLRSVHLGSRGTLVNYRGASSSP